MPIHYEKRLKIFLKNRLSDSIHSTIKYNHGLGAENRKKTKMYSLVC